MNKTTMKLIKNTALTFGVFALSFSSLAQKSVETSAAVEYKNKFQPAMMKGDLEGAKKALLSAKSYIDEAAAHEDTRNSQKTLWLQGEIYGALALLSAQDSNFVDVSPEDAIEKALISFEKGYPLGKKYKRDIEESVNRTAIAMFTAGGMAYEQEKFADAAEAYELASRYRASVGTLDTTSIYNSALCYERIENYEKAAANYEKAAKAGYRGVNSVVAAANAYVADKNFDKAKELINEARKDNPTNRELLLALADASIQSGDNAGAEKALSDAIASDPENKQLHYVIGTIYSELGKNEQAEEALNKALELDPNYADAMYQLGAHLVTWAGNIKQETDALKFGDPKYNQMKQQYEDTYKRALTPLEKYIGVYPEDKAVLTILFQIHRNIGNSEKALEYKKRADALD